MVWKNVVCNTMRIIIMSEFGAGEINVLNVDFMLKIPVMCHECILLTNNT